MVDVNIIVPAIDVVFAQELCVIGFVNGALKRFAFADIFAAHVNIASVRAHSETGNQATFDQRMRVMAHDFAVFTGAGLGLIGIDHQVMRAAIGYFWHERPFKTRREARATATAKAGRLHLIDDPVLALGNQPLGIIPMTTRHRARQ